MKSEEEDDIHLPSPAMFNPLATPPTLLPFPSAQALVHQQKPLYGQQCCFYSCYIYPQSCPSGAAGTADLKQSFTLMTGGQSRNSRMLTSTVIWPAESYRGWREIHSLMTTTNTDVALFQRYNSRLQWDCFCFHGPNQTCVIQTSNLASSERRGGKLGVCLLLIAASMIRLSCLFLT